MHFWIQAIWHAYFSLYIETYKVCDILADLELECLDIVLIEIKYNMDRYEQNDIWSNIKIMHNL